MQAKIALLPGDGIGPEVVGAARRVLAAVETRFGHSFQCREYPIGGIAIDQTGSPLPVETYEGCQTADGILLGAVGGPKWDDPTQSVRPEQGLLGLRKSLDLFANLRPIQPHPALLHASPVKAELLQGVDILMVRELTGGIYFGQPRHRRQVNGEAQAVDTMVYTESEIRRVAQVAFQLAQNRRGKVTSIDKANVLECSRLWRQTVAATATEYPQVALEHLLVDAAAMYLIARPQAFDVMVTENMFGDILTDEASVLAGSIGNMPSASLGAEVNFLGFPIGLYEPIHGSAPDIAGKGIANPVGTILSLAMLLRHSLGLEEEARAVETAVSETITSGNLTADLVPLGQPALSTEGMGAVIIQRILATQPERAG
jgi:3-isopropylmalate dehydrogenase